MAEQQAITDELKRHIPVFAAMIQLAHEHIMDQPRVAQECRGLMAGP